MSIMYLEVQIMNTNSIRFYSSRERCDVGTYVKHTCKNMNKYYATLLLRDTFIGNIESIWYEYG